MTSDLRPPDMERKPRVSIVMPVYNQVRFIERSILSVLDQGYSNLELILIDGGSTDGSLDIIKKYETRIAYWRSEADKGQSDALNIGFTLATGAIFGWLNSDDVYSDDSIRMSVDALLSNPRKKIVYGDWLNIDENGNVIDREYAYPPNPNHYKYEGVSMNAQAMFWHRDVHERFGKFDVDLYNTMDYEMVLGFALNEKPESFLRLPMVLGSFRRHSEQKTNSRNNQRQLFEHRLLSERYGYADKYTLYGKLKRYVFRARRAYWFLKRAGMLYTFNRFIHAREFQFSAKRSSEDGSF